MISGPTRCSTGRSRLRDSSCGRTATRTSSPEEGVDGSGARALGRRVPALVVARSCVPGRSLASSPLRRSVLCGPWGRAGKGRPGPLPTGSHLEPARMERGLAQRGPQSARAVRNLVRRRGQDDRLRPHLPGPLPSRRRPYPHPPPPLFPSSASHTPLSPHSLR